jgi:hypothetical protein
MFKKFIGLIFLASILSTFMFSTTAFADSTIHYYDNYTYVINPDGKSVTIISLPAYVRDIVIPSHFDGRRVTCIGSGVERSSVYAYDTTYCNSIVIPKTVTTINYYAFYDSNIDNITIPNSVTSIGDYAFADMNHFIDITIPNSVKSIGDYAFYDTGFTNITIPSSVTSIGARAFECPPIKGGYGEDDFVIVNHILLKYQGSDTNVTIPGNVKTINDYAFENCD